MSGEDIYIVEELLKKRTKKNKTEYLVKWVGWSEQHNSWEPRSNILDKNLIAEFEAEWSKSSRSTPKHPKTPNSAISSLSSKSESTFTFSAADTKLSPTRKRKFEIDESESVIDFESSELISPFQFDDEKEEIKIGQKEVKKPTKKIPGAAKRSRVYPNYFDQKNVFVTQVTAQNVTVMIAESNTPEGFFDTHPTTE